MIIEKYTERNQCLLNPNQACEYSRRTLNIRATQGPSLVKPLGRDALVASRLKDVPDHQTASLKGAQSKQNLEIFKRTTQFKKVIEYTALHKRQLRNQHEYMNKVLLTRLI